MTEKELKRTYREVCRNLESRRLKPAFDLLEKLITEYGFGAYGDQHRNLEETYHFMLKYTVEGIRDPERQKVYRKLIVSVFELTDNVFESIRLRISPSIEYEKKRIFKNDFIENIQAYIVELEEICLADYSEDKSHEKRLLQKMQKLFYHIWFRDKLTRSEVDQIQIFNVSPVIPTHYKSFVVTAITLSLQRFFDPEKIMLLFEAYKSSDSEIEQRAVTGLLLCLDQYDKRVTYYPDIVARLKLHNEDPQFKSDIERIILQLIRSKETEKLQQRIIDEILPEMIKISPILKDKINLDSLMEEEFSEERNPDWQDIFKDTPGLMDKMEEFSELQMEGADVFMGSFAMLKSFPFFSETGNWFIPFFVNHPELIEANDDRDLSTKQLFDIIEKAPILCNSDKYSFSLSLGNLPKESREFMIQGIRAEIDQLKELERDEELTRPGSRAKYILNQYIQDLYRFYKLYPRRADFEDIFNRRFDFHNSAVLGAILKDDPVVLKNIAEYYFARNYFIEAAEIFEYLLQTEKTGELYQKAAFCRQKTGDFSGALDLYLKAELFDINRLWNHKKIAVCYRNLKQTEKALEYYEAIERIDPDSLNNQLNIGHCLLELKKYPEALKCYFKVEYLAPGNRKVWRPIAWCSFLSGKRDQAYNYLNKLMEDTPNKHDYMNLGHVLWSLGKRKEALDSYKMSISSEGFSDQEFILIFEEDLPYLLEQGVEEDDVPIMLDQLRYLVAREL